MTTEQISSIDQHQSYEVGREVVTNQRLSTHRLEKDFMAPEFLAGEVITIDSQITPKDGDYVLVESCRNQLHFGQISIDAHSGKSTFSNKADFWHRLNLQATDFEVLGVCVEQSRLRYDYSRRPRS